MTMSLSTGLISGMDTGSLIAQLIQAEAAPKTALQARLKTTQDAVSAFQTVNTTFLAVTAAAEAALRPEAWTPIKATSSAPGVAVSATAGATEGSLSFTVKKLAAAHAEMNTNGTTWSSSASLYGAGEIEFFDENDVASPTKITIGGTGTLADAVAAINDSPHGLTASIIQVKPGEAAIRITANETGAASKFRLVGAGTMSTNTAAADAQIALGDAATAVTISSSTNTFDSVMPGATFTVSKVDEQATLTIASDPGAVAAKMQTLVDAVNAAAKTARDYTSNAPGSKAVLKGDYAVGSLVGRLLDAVSFAVVNPADGKKISPATMGIQLSKDGTKVEFDKNVFLNALKADPTLAQRVVGGTAAGIGADELPGTADDVASTGVAGRLLAVAKAASDSTTGSLVALSKGQESLIKGYQERIEAWDLRLAKRKEMLTRQFTAMETALSSLRNQSTWLAGQINQLSAG